MPGFPCASARPALPLCAALDGGWGAGGRPLSPLLLDGTHAMVGGAIDEFVLEEGVKEGNVDDLL